MAAISQARPARTTNVRTPLFILGVGLALLAFLVMFAFGILFANRSQTGSQVRVVVAAQDIDAREPITPDMLTTAAIPSTAVPPHYFLRAADLPGIPALVASYSAQTVTGNVV